MKEVKIYFIFFFDGEWMLSSYISVIPRDLINTLDDKSILGYSSDAI